jgi:hypothetical protein
MALTVVVPPPQPEFFLTPVHRGCSNPEMIQSLWISWTTTIALKPRAWSHVSFPHKVRNRLRTTMTLHFLPPASDAYDAAVEDAIATCNGDVRGALKALIIANEFLERDLARALASIAAPSIADDWNVGVRRVDWVEAE